MERASKRDENKLSNWNEYKISLKDITPDTKYNALIYDNSQSLKNQDLQPILVWLQN